MEYEVIETLDDERVACYSSLTDVQLRNRLRPEEGVMIVESPKVISTALDAGCRPLSLLCERRHLEGDAAPLLARLGNAPVYTGERKMLESLTGYRLTRGVLCAMRRPALPSAADICRGAKRIAIIAGVCDTTNIGSIFRSAAALGIDGILLTPDSCDPLNRRSIRVSMGTVFQVPWGRVSSPEDVGRLGFETVAMALTDRSVGIDAPELRDAHRLAIILGTEGEGLPEEIIERADHVARIPMHHGVDSLNVGAAAAVAFWELRSRREADELNL